MSNRFPIAMLFFAACCWGINVPVMKVLAAEQALLAPQISSLTVSAAALAVRFAVATLFISLISRVALRRILPVEWLNGTALGAITAISIWLQADALNYTSASTAGFLIALYCVFIPLLSWIIGRHKMSLHLVICCLLVVAGMATLSGLNSLALGRGEWESIGAAMLFALQIMWVDRIEPGRCNPARMTWVLCAAVSVFCALAIVALPNGLPAFIATHASPRAGWLTVYLAVIGTAVPFLVMNRFQSQINSTSAGFIYCFEPIASALCALFLPELIGRAGGGYLNECLTLRVAIGGGLILAANLLLLRNPADTAKV